MNFQVAYNRVEKIPGWFSIEDAEAIFPLILKSQKIVEVGSFLGKSSMFISSFKNVTCIDPWTGMSKKLLTVGLKCEDDYYDFFKQFTFEHKEKITTIRNLDKEVFNNWSEAKIDLLFLDHAHTYDSVYESLIGWKPHMQKFGKIFIHDGNWIQVKNAIDDSKINQLKIYKKSVFEPILCSWDNFKYL